MNHSNWTKNAVIYEVNIRQFTKEGSFIAFQKHLPRLKEMGVKILWLMPIYPVGIKNRKGSLGSYYSVKDFEDVNAEYGSKDDFKNLVDEIHRLGMKIILDWVANHSSWDNKWLENNPEFFKKDHNNNLVSPYDWTDAIALNYDNNGLRKAMISALKFWIKNFDIDGYRCDVAGLVPTDFWEEARIELNKLKDIFMLAEDEENQDLMRFAFDMNHDWKLHKIFNAISKGEKSATDIKTYFENNNQLKKTYYRMIFTSNHDENSWNGSEYERMGAAVKIMAVLTASLPGMMLIYSGQEAALNKKLNFFDKDLIEWENIPLHNFYKNLIELIKSNSAFWNGNFGGDFEPLKNNMENEVLSFYRNIDSSSAICVFNLSPKTNICQIQTNDLNGNYSEWFSKQEFKIESIHKLVLAPWEFMIFVKT